MVMAALYVCVTPATVTPSPISTHQTFLQYSSFPPTRLDGAGRSLVATLSISPMMIVASVMFHQVGVAFLFIYLVLWSLYCEWSHQVQKAWPPANLYSTSTNYLPQPTSGGSANGNCMSISSRLHLQSQRGNTSYCQPIREHRGGSTGDHFTFI